MQLFIIDTPIESGQILLADSGLVHQLSRVLRMNVGSQITMQWYEGTTTHRGRYQITDLSKKSVSVERIGTIESRNHNHGGVTMAIALPNKRSKAELIVQKLSEIGVRQIVRFAAHRSQYISLPDKKLLRMQDISKEATEQSWGWERTEVRFVTDMRELVQGADEVWIGEVEKKEERRKNAECRIQSLETETAPQRVTGGRTEKGQTIRHPERSVGSCEDGTNEGISDTSTMDSRLHGNDSAKNAVESDSTPPQRHVLHAAIRTVGLSKNILILIGPEGGWASQDYEMLEGIEYCSLNLGERVLRMETAAIVAARKGVNLGN